MRALHIAALIAATTSASFAHAAMAVPVTDTASSAVQVQGVPSGRYRMHADDYKNFQGKYLLSDGKVLTLSNANKRYFAQIEGQTPVEIVAIGSKSFVAPKADMKLMFDQHRNGRNHDVVVAPRG